jgi:hypothetical protein
VSGCDEIETVLFWFMAFSPLLSRFFRGTRSEAKRGALLPRQGLHFRERGPELVSGEESGKSRRPSSEGRSYSAEAVPERNGTERKTWAMPAPRSSRGINPMPRAGVFSR